MTRRESKSLNDTPPPSPPKRYKHHDTSIRCKIKDIIQYLTAIDLSFDSVTIANFHRNDGEQFFKASVYRILHGSDRTRHNDLSKSIKTCHPPYKLIDAQVAEANHIIKESELHLKGKTLSWNGLSVEIGIDCHSDTVRNIIHKALDNWLIAQLSYVLLTTYLVHKCIVAMKTNLFDQINLQRLNFVDEKLRIIDQKSKNWKKIRFSNKIHETFAFLKKL